MYIRGHSSQKMGDFFMEENYLIQSKIHTRAIVSVMTRMVNKKQASIADYHDLYHHWQLLMNINAPMYENMSDCNRGEHLEVTLTKLRQNMLDYTACAKSLLNDLVEIMSLYTLNADLFKSLYADTYGLREMMERHLDEREKLFQPMAERNALRREVDKELNMLLYSRGRNEDKFRRELEELEDKYGITINYDNIQYWFTRSKDYYEEYDEQYKEFLSYKGRCLVSVQYDCGLSSCQIAKRIYDVLDKDLRNNDPSVFVYAQRNEFVHNEVTHNTENVYENHYHQHNQITQNNKTINHTVNNTSLNTLNVHSEKHDHYSTTNLYLEPKSKRLTAGKVYISQDICSSFYRSGAVDLFLANCSEESFYQLMNLNSPTPETGIQLIYVDGLYYVLRILKDFLIDKGRTQDWINSVLKSFGKNYKTFEAHSNDVFTDSENEKSGAYQLYPIIKDWLKFRKKA